MKVAAAVAEILKREGVEFLIGYPVNPIIEAAAEADIRTIIVRQERTGLHMADAVSRVTLRRADRRLRHAARARHRERLRRRGPGVRRFRRRSSCCPAAIPRRLHQRPAELQRRSSTSSTSPSGASRSPSPSAVPDALRRAFTQVRNGRPRPVAGRDPRRRHGGGDRRAARLHARPARCARRPTRSAVARGRRACWSRPSGRSSTPARASTTPRPGRSCGAGRAAGSAGHHQPRRARAPSPRTTRCRSARAAASMPEGGPRLPRRTPTSSSASAAASRTTNYGVHHAARARRSSTPRSTRPTSTRTCRSSTRWSATPALTLRRADRRGAGPAEGQAARPRATAVAARDRRSARGVARASGRRS